MSVIIGAFSVVSLVLFICSIIIVAGRSVQWYQEFNKVEPD
jgi:hypothetical protein